MNLAALDLQAAAKGLKEKTFSSRELVQSCLDRIKKVDGRVKAFVTVCEKEALTQADNADKLLSAGEQKPLLGLPVAVKDNFCTRGIKTTASAKILADYLPPYDATVINHLKDAGAILLGKTNMDAWAHGSSTETSDFFTTRNPWDLNRLPGGSSGGSAAAIAADETIFAIGSETAGSIRQPASWCGTVGFKPTYGRVSRYGVVAMASSLDCPGPITKTIADAALVLSVLAGADGYDATLSSQPPENYLSFLGKGVKGLKIGLPKEYFFKEIEPEVASLVRQAIQKLEKLGARIKEVSLLDPKYSVAVYTLAQRSEVSSNLARYDGVRYGAGREDFGAEAKRRIMIGTYSLSSGYYDQYYAKAQKVRRLICEDFDRVFKEVDLIAAPTSPSVALPVGAAAESAMFGEMQDILVEASSLAGLPGVNLPCGFASSGLPVGLQLFGPQFQEGRVFQAAAAYEKIAPWLQVKPALN